MLSAVNHSGDSDSTGSIAGNILGAAHGVEWLPTPWLDELELRDVIDAVAVDSHRSFYGDGDAAAGDLSDWWERYPGR